MINSLLSVLLFFSSGAFCKEAPFRFHLFNEPSQLDPQNQRNSASAYLQNNLHRNFFWYDDQKGLIPDLGEKCERPQKKHLRCTLKKNLKWSDGSALTANDFIESYQRFLNPILKAPRADLLFKIKNAESVYLGTKKPAELGVHKINDQQFEFELVDDDLEFEYTLAHFLTVPVKQRDLSLQNKFSTENAPQLIVSGPYKIKNWTKNDRIYLIKNDNYQGGNPSRPDLEIRFIEEDSVALGLYEKNELDFLRRLPTLYFSKWKSTKDFNWLSVIRFDYFGFGPDLVNYPELRQALGLSLDYPKLQALFQSDGTPGCAGVPESWVQELPCLKMDLSLLQKLKSAKTWKIPKNMILKYSTQGGEDHKRAVEWIQSEWLKNLDLRIESQSLENKIYTAELKTKPPTVFRRGVSPERPTCLAVLETFSEQNPDNFIHMKDDRYFKILNELSQMHSDFEKKQLCQKGIEFLLQNYYLIPTGGIHFAILAKPGFTGWKLNGMNQLDLANLRSH